MLGYDSDEHRLPALDKRRGRLDVAEAVAAVVVLVISIFAVGFVAGVVFGP